MYVCVLGRVKLGGIFKKVDMDLNPQRIRKKINSLDNWVYTSDMCEMKGTNSSAHHFAVLLFRANSLMSGLSKDMWMNVDNFHINLTVRAKQPYWFCFLIKQ